MEQKVLNNLAITALSLRAFRNYKSLDLKSLNNLSIFVGKNAIGKTSIIEAIQLLCDLKSFRTNQSDQLVLWGENTAFIAIEITDGVRQLQEELHIVEGKRQYFLNGKKKRIHDLKGLLPAVVFTPDDLDLVKGSYSKRRDAIDNLGVQLSKNFYSVRADYQKLIKQKNQALKDEAPNTYIESLNDVLVKVGSQYCIHRLTLINSFLPFFIEAYKTTTSNLELASITYELSWDEEIKDFSQVNKEVLTQQFQQALSRSFEEERQSKRSKIGPHADHIDFNIAENNENSFFRQASAFASQGQQRSLVLAFKMAELRTIQEVIHQQPILLLDDVMSELDESRRKMFMDMVAGEVQTFITTTNLNYFEDKILNMADVYTLPFEQ